MTRNILLALATVASLAAIETTPAAAGGFLADTFLRPLSPQIADIADGVHKQIGQPLDQVAGQVVRSTGAPLGNRCLLPNGAAFFGPFNPVGMPCNVGSAVGYIVQ